MTLIAMALTRAELSIGNRHKSLNLDSLKSLKLRYIFFYFCALGHFNNLRDLGQTLKL